MNDQEQKITEELEAMGFTMAAQFVPFSQSRNAKELPKLSELSINWKVTITANGAHFTRDYAQGIGRLPEHLQVAWRSGFSITPKRAIYEAVETGSGAAEIGREETKPLDPPSLAEVMYCVAMNSDAIDYQSFEDWAESLGLDTDSLKAETTYQTCLRGGLFLRDAVGDSGLHNLQRLLKDLFGPGAA